jgi:hypothetical protein
MNDFETTMNSASFADPTNGYNKYIDVGSFVDFFIVNEISKNVDAYRLSTYLYKDNISKGGKLHIGPVWDYDLAWHNCNYGNSFDATGWEYPLTDSMYPSPTWWNRFVQDTNFVNLVYCRWNQLRQGILKTTNLYTYIDTTKNILNESQQRNFIQWPILGAYVFPNPQYQLHTNYTNEVNDLKNWITNRVTWMDGAITGHCITSDIKESNFDNYISVYPNPFQYTTTFEIHLAEEADISLSIVDLLGKEISTLLNEHRSPGVFNINFEKQQAAAGVYFYKLKINNTMETGKIVIQ